MTWSKVWLCAGLLMPSLACGGDSSNDGLPNTTLDATGVTDGGSTDPDSGASTDPTGGSGDGGSSGPMDSSDGGDATGGSDATGGGSPCQYPPGSVEPMTLGEVITPYRWDTAIHGDGTIAALDLKNVPCDDDPNIEWSPHDVLVFVSIPAW